MGRRIFLIGYMGSGKTTIGKLLAKKLDLPFYDTDALIEEKEGKTISEIFSSEGEIYFRKLEKEILSYIKDKLPAGVFATGGGMPCFHNLIDTINSLGTSVYLSIGDKYIIARISKDTNRPLVKERSLAEIRNFVKKHKSSRIPFYRRANFVVRANREPVKIIERVTSLLGSYDKTDQVS